MKANSIRELVKVRDRLDAWRETAQRSVDYEDIRDLLLEKINEANRLSGLPPLSSERPGLRIRNRNLVTNYEALIKQLNAVIETEMS